MARVLFDTVRDGVPVTVVAGWDRPLREFFMQVEYRGGENDGEALWTDWALVPSEKQDTKMLRTILNHLGILPPEDFWARVEQREGNVVHRFTTTPVPHWQTL